MTDAAVTDAPMAAEAACLPPELIMHFREGCHLCEDMQQQLIELFEPDEFRLTLIDIDEDEELRHAYNVRVPVLSLVSLPARLRREQCTFDADQAVAEPQSGGNYTEVGALEELCEHFLDLVAVREALASYNKPLLVACSVPVDR